MVFLALRPNLPVTHTTVTAAECRFKSIVRPSTNHFERITLDWIFFITVIADQDLIELLTLDMHGVTVACVQSHLTTRFYNVDACKNVDLIIVLGLWREIRYSNSKIYTHLSISSFVCISSSAHQVL